MTMFKKVFFSLIATSLAIGVTSCGSKTTANSTSPSSSSKPTTSYQVVENVIGQEGGKVKEGNNIEINIPQNALNQDTTITAQYVDSEKDISNDVSNNFLGAVEFGPSGTVFEQPVAVSLKLNTTPTNNTLSVFCYDQVNNVWDYVTSANYINGNANFNITHFSKYQVLDITPDMYMKFVDLVHEAQASGKSDAWIRDSYESYLVDEKHVMDYYQEYDGYYYEPCGLRVFGKYQLNGKEGNQEDLAIVNGSTNKTGNSYGVSTVGGLTVSRAEADKASNNQDTIDVTVTIDYKIINPDFSLSASKTKVKKGESTTINVYCHYAKPGNVVYPDIALPGYPLNVSQPSHFTIDKTIITTDGNGRASFVATSKDGKEDTLKVIFNDSGAYAEGSIKLNTEDGYKFSGHIKEIKSFDFISKTPGDLQIATTQTGTFKLTFEYDFTGELSEDNNGLSGSIQFSNVTASITTNPWKGVAHDEDDVAYYTFDVYKQLGSVQPNINSIAVTGTKSSNGICSLSFAEANQEIAVLNGVGKDETLIVGGGESENFSEDISFKITMSSSNPLLEFNLEGVGQQQNNSTSLKDSYKEQFYVGGTEISAATGWGFINSNESESTTQTITIE